MKRTLRVALIADLHCGHVSGLTPPSWQLRPAEPDGAMSGKRNKWVVLERVLWARYRSLVGRIGPVDLLVIVGDCIDGRGPKTGGTELISTDRNQQAEMAVRCISEWRAGKIVMVYGTDYHVGETENYEDVIADEVRADKIGAHEWVDVRGLILDVKHHVSSSSVPHTQGTAISRDALWNAIWAARLEQPQADMIVRAHIHSYYRFETAHWSGFTMPALQGMGSRFGQRRMSKTVDWGLVWMDVRGKHDYDFHPEIVRFQEQRAQVIRV